MEEIRGPQGRTMWDKLGNVNEVVLANYLKNEYPQTVAVVLSKIMADHAARVLAQLPEGFSMEVIMRMLRMDAVQKEVLDDVESTLRNEFITNLARTNRRDPHEMIAEIFNNLDRGAEARFMTALEERNRDIGRAHQEALMFTFEDLVQARHPLRDPDPAAQRREGQGADRPQGRVAGAAQGSVLHEHVGARRPRCCARRSQAMGPVRLARRRRGAEPTSSVGGQGAAGARGEIIIADGSADDELVY